MLFFRTNVSGFYFCKKVSFKALHIYFTSLSNTSLLQKKRHAKDT
nr:MAG TPA: hypothetical protein [Caudoviricetes sp.]